MEGAGSGPAGREARTLDRRARLPPGLAGNGCDFIHSDADAFWLRDPRPWLLRHPGYDLLFSQGTTFPRSHYHRHRFVLCAGFFASRANGRTRDYFTHVDALLEEHPDDQLCMNTVLLRDRARSWNLASPIPAVRRKGRWVRPRSAQRISACARSVLSCPPLRALSNGMLRLCRLDYILTSREIIHGRFSTGLTAGIIPMHIVMRGAFAQWGDPLVLHSSRNKVL